MPFSAHYEQIAGNTGVVWIYSDGGSFEEKSSPSQALTVVRDGPTAVLQSPRISEELFGVVAERLREAGFKGIVWRRGWGH